MATPAPSMTLRGILAVTALVLLASAIEPGLEAGRASSAQELPLVEGSETEDQREIRWRSAEARILTARLIFIRERRHHLGGGRRCHAVRDYICLDPAEHDCGEMALEDCPSVRLLDSFFDVVWDVATDAPDNPLVISMAVAANIFGQRFPEAETLMRACRADEWVCAMLEGFFYTSLGRMRTAELAFDRALATMSEEERCTDWTDLREIVDPWMRRSYVGLSCAERQEANRTLWWLADPLYLVPGNERRAAHMARMAYVRIEDATLERHWTGPEDLRDWCPPAHILPDCDSGHTLAGHQEVIPFGRVWRTPAPRQPDVPFDNEKGRYSFLPSENAFLDPFRSIPEDYEVDPRPLREGYTPIHEEYVELNHQIAVFERGFRDGPQVASVRGDSIEVVAASEPPIHEMSRVPGRLFGLVLGTGPDDPPLIERRVDLAERYLFRLHQPRRRYLASLEMISPLPGAARARRGIGLPEGPEQRLRASDLLLFEPGEEIPVTLDEAVELIYPRTLVGAGTRLGIFWETYGVLPEEAVQVTLRLERLRGVLGRIGQALGVVSEEVTIGWDDVSFGEGRTIWPRTLILDLEGYEPGDYLVRLTLTAPDQEPFEVVREMTIR